MPIARPLTEALDAIMVGDGAGARRALEQADRSDPAVLEMLARAAYLELDFSNAVDLWESAYGTYSRAGDRSGEIRVARTLAGIFTAVVGDTAVASGWIARARTLLADEESLDAGWVALNVGMFEADRVRREDQFRRSLGIARRFGDCELEVIALSYLGASLVHDDRTEEGMALLDEALAATAGGEVNNFLVLEEVFCQLFAACEHAYDVHRADQWIRVGDAIARRQSLPAVSAFCRTHYGGVLTAAGRWPEADAALTEAVQLWGAISRSGLRAGAIVRLADLRIRQGRLEEADELLDDPYVDPDSAAPLLALIRLAQGQADLATELISRTLPRTEPGSTAAARLLVILVDCHLAAGRTAQAAAAAEELRDCLVGQHNVYLAAASALAQGQVALARGHDPDEALSLLRQALHGFSHAQTPMELATTHLAIARALATSKPEVALAEARAALDAYSRLHAARQVDAAAAMMRSLGARPPSPAPSAQLLTAREAEVLDLLGLGMSNPDIAARLFISRKTVEHHVGNILAKLHVRNRAEAVAYAARRRLVSG